SSAICVAELASENVGNPISNSMASRESLNLLCFMRVFYNTCDMEQRYSDEMLVALSLEDKERFGELIERYESKLGRYIARLGIRTAEDRQDVLQEIFLKVYKNLNGFDPKLSFSSWIYRIAHNEAISWYRKQSVRPEGNLI